MTEGLSMHARAHTAPCERDVGRAWSRLSSNAGLGVGRGVTWELGPQMGTVHSPCPEPTLAPPPSGECLLLQHKVLPTQQQGLMPDGLLLSTSSWRYVHAQPCPTLCDPMDCGPPGSSVHEVFQARILEWVPFPPLGDLLTHPGIEPESLQSRQVHCR